MPSEKIKILVIDDEEIFCRLVKKVLELSGNYEVITATEGKQGIADAQRHQPDLIFLDLMLPDLNGTEVLKTLKENRQTKSIPVIMLTAKEADESMLQATDLSEGYIVKPVDIEALKSKIERVLSSRRLSPEKEPAFDKKVFSDYAQGDSDFAAELVRSFLKILPEYIAGIEAAINNRNSEELEFSAHRLRGSAGNFRAKKVMDAALELETMGRNKNLVDPEKSWQRLNREIIQLKEEMEIFLKTNK
ncbi:MAG: response regulator [Candidatus Omnitrophota bacterium]